MKHLKVTFLGGFIKYYPCDNIVVLFSLKLLFLYPTEAATRPHETVNYGNVSDFKFVMLRAADEPRYDNPLSEEANYDNPLN